ncbi:hypothetical protein BHC51_07400 [Snodgrassella alvi]|nr:hypothetical protein BHC51_07400 [Snodgrassella alvi]
MYQSAKLWLRPQKLSQTIDAVTANKVLHNLIMYEYWIKGCSVDINIFVNSFRFIITGLDCN